MVETACQDTGKQPRPGEGFSGRFEGSEHVLPSALRRNCFLLTLWDFFGQQLFKEPEVCQGSVLEFHHLALRGRSRKLRTKTTKKKKILMGFLTKETRTMQVEFLQAPGPD